MCGFPQFIDAFSKVLVDDTSVVLRVKTAMDAALDQAGVYVGPETKAKYLRSLLRGVMKEDAVRKLR